MGNVQPNFVSCFVFFSLVCLSYVIFFFLYTNMLESIMADRCFSSEFFEESF